MDTQILLDQIEEGVIVIDKDLKVVKINGMALSLIGCSESVALRSSLSSLLFGGTPFEEKHNELMKYDYNDISKFQLKTDNSISQ